MSIKHQYCKTPPNMQVKKSQSHQPALSYQSKNLLYFKTPSNVYQIKNQQLKKYRQKLKISARLLFSVTLSFSIYVFVIANIEVIYLFLKTREQVNLTLTIIFSLLFAHLALMSHKDKSYFGITFKQTWPALKEAMLFSLVSIGILFAFKQILITHYPPYAQLTLLSLEMAPPLLMILLYCFVIAPLQELIVRCCIQSAIYQILHGRFRILYSILFSNLVFSITHMTFPWPVMLISFIAGIGWGWLFSRYQSWIAVSLSHATVGAAFFTVIGFPELV